MLLKALFARSCKPLATILCSMGLMISLLLMPLAAQAQTSQKPLNLGDVLKKETKKAAPPPVYLKLPETIPVPASNPLKGKPEEQGNVNATPALPGQITANAPAAQRNTPPPPPGADQPLPGTTAAPDGQPPLLPQAPAQAAEPKAPAEPEIKPGGIAKLYLMALLDEQGQELRRGVNWRIFSDKKDENGNLQLLNNLDGGSFEVKLEPGSYIVYVGYGFANLTKRVILPKAGNYKEDFVLNAGALRLNAVASGDVKLDEKILRFSVYTSDEADEGAHTLLVKNVKPNHVVKLTEGTYHIISSYGTANATVRGDVEVKAGKLINVTMIHSAAKTTLRLVSEPGGEALANTIWTVFTPGGDVVKRAIGAFPTLALAAGNYTAIAKQGNEVYNRDFTVTSGVNREIEVIATATQ
ncbi:hypothetical protein [uncultured Cohaesibacter sp.]|uniref:hypothetical protein n=1 Tax=uncultured Cohaesibacter sp. TaxID=1002546 RepID=UPI00292CF110|nr:hypothetical protein [uncultured Cohaesibacter sp.]